MAIESVMPSNHIILCCPLFLSPSVFPSIQVFSSESVLHNRWPKYWSFTFSINSSNEYSGLISFRIDWLISLHYLNTIKVLTLTVKTLSGKKKYKLMSLITKNAKFLKYVRNKRKIMIMWDLPSVSEVASAFGC